MKKYICFYISIYTLIIINLSFTWPVTDMRVTSSFGESRGDHFHDGIDLVSNDARIFPAEEGRLVFLWDKSLFPLENYPGGGNYRILKHDSGYYSIYMHLADNPEFRTAYGMNDLIGEIGDTGHSSGKHLHLSMLNSESLKSLNPLLYFPKVKDKEAPHIENVYIRIDDKYFRIRDNDTIRLTRHYPLLIDIYDSINRTEKLGIYKLVVIFNGEKVVDNEYSEIVLLKNGLTISGKSFQDLFDERGYYKVSDITYNEGTNKLLIRATDYSGNETSMSTSFKVNLDIQ